MEASITNSLISGIFFLKLDILHSTQDSIVQQIVHQQSLTLMDKKENFFIVVTQLKT